MYKNLKKKKDIDTIKNRKRKTRKKEQGKKKGRNKGENRKNAK